MTSIHELIGSGTLKTEDLGGSEKTVRLTGVSIGNVEWDGVKQQKAMLEFEGLPAKMLVKCQAVKVALLELFKTDQIEEWNRQCQESPIYLTLFSEQTPLGPGLRIRQATGPAQVHPQPGQAQMTPEQMMTMMQQMMQQNNSG